MLTRRDFVMLCGAAAAASAFPSRSRGAWAWYIELNAGQATPVRDGVWAIVAGPSGGNSLLIATSAAPVLVDTKHAHLGQSLMEVCKNTAKAGPALVINTHHHADHTGGNHAFSDAATIVAHAKVKPRLAANIDRYQKSLLDHARRLDSAGMTDEARQWTEKAGSLKVEQFAADFEFDNAHLMDHGGVDIHARHFGPGHTDNDIVIFLPAHNVLHTGDLVFNRVHPFIDLSAGATTIGWQNSLREAIKLCDDKTVVIPGHGPVADKAALERQIAYFDTLRSVVKKARDEGKSREEVAKLDPSVFRDIDDHGRAPMTLGAMFDELSR